MLSETTYTDYIAKSSLSTAKANLAGKKLLLILILHYSFCILNYSQQSGWQVIPSGTTNELQSIHFTYTGIGYACGNSGTILKSLDEGITWNQVTIPTSVKLNDIFVFDQNVAIAVGDGGTIIRTDNGGLNWSVIPSDVTDDLLSISFVDSFGICGARSQTILYSSNSGTSWNIAQSGWIGGGFWGAVMLSPQIGFLAGENSIFQPLLGMTTDSGQNWNYTAFYLNNNEGRATGVDFTDMFIGYASVRVWDGRGAISKTTNSGNTWVTTFFNNPLWGIGFPISNAGHGGYAVGDSGVILKTYDAGTSWQTQQSGTSLRLNKVYFIDLDFGFAVGDSGIILRTTTGGEPATPVEDDDSPVNDFKLSQNYPNPFNPSTKISWQSPIGSRQTLKIYDVLGNEIVTLVDEYKPAGSHEVVFNASKVSSGIYFYQLKAGNFSKTKKMILIK
jgi:photosystem II stability/assembly factor-like uncharacterized protein